MSNCRAPSAAPQLHVRPATWLKIASPASGFHMLLSRSLAEGLTAEHLKEPHKLLDHLALVKRAVTARPSPEAAAGECSKFQFLQGSPVTTRCRMLVQTLTQGHMSR